jgi:CheY-like chemotaxis protein
MVGAGIFSTLHGLVDAGHVGALDNGSLLTAPLANPRGRRLLRSSFHLIFVSIKPLFCPNNSSDIMDPKNILYAEDNPDDVFILKLAFKRAGITQMVRSIDDGEDAIAWLRGEGDFANRQQYPLPDLLLLDLKMPRKSGFDVLEWLAESREFQHLPTIILSSSDDPRDLKRAAELGATKYFKKSALCKDVIQYLKTLPA